MRFTLEVLQCIAAGWLQFKNGHIKEAYLVYRSGGDGERYLDFVMQKDSWYYGQGCYAIFVEGRYAGKFTPEAMDVIAAQLYPGEYKAKEQSAQ
jgi:hypothetical protein